MTALQTLMCFAVVLVLAAQINVIHAQIPQHPDRFVTRIFFINSDDRIDRRDRMELHLQEVARDINVVRKPAIHISSVDGALSDPQFFNVLHNRPISEDIIAGTKPNAIFSTAVYLSHSTLYKHIWEKQLFDGPDHGILILEDDALLPVDWETQLQDRLRNVPSDWEIIRLGTWGDVRESDQVGSGVYAARPPFWVSDTTTFYGGAHAVLLRPKTMGQFLEKFSKIPVWDVDGMMTRCCDELKSYVLYPNVVSLDRTAEDSDNTGNVQSYEHSINSGGSNSLTPLPQ